MYEFLVSETPNKNKKFFTESIDLTLGGEAKPIHKGRFTVTLDDLSTSINAAQITIHSINNPEKHIFKKKGENYIFDINSYKYNIIFQEAKEKSAKFYIVELK